jgi:hypothetical protein
MLSIEDFARAIGVSVEYADCDRAHWISSAMVIAENGTQTELALSVKEAALATVTVDHAHVLWGYFPYKAGITLFEAMHHNSEDRAKKLANSIKQPLNGKTQYYGGDNYLLAGPTDNFWHFLYNFALRLAFVKQKFGSVESSPYTFIAPDDLKPDFIAAAQRMGIPATRLRQIKIEEAIQFERLTFTQLPFYFKADGLVGSRLASQMMFGENGVGAGRVYISRGDARWRKVLNEDELIPMLERRGFKIIRLTDMGLPELIELMASAKVVVGSSGANLAPTAYCPAGATVIELSYPPMAKKYYFQVSSTANKQSHIKVVGIPEETENGYHTWNFRVPMGALQTALEMTV